MSDDDRLLTGWGGTAPSRARAVTACVHDVADAVTAAGPRGIIARGLGRSYGDPAQNAGGDVLAPLPSRIDLDEGTGIVRASAGTSLHELIRAALPRGWFVPVTPGTRYVTLGGAIAADVHGKNHHRDGGFGAHVRELRLVTADGSERTVSPEQDAELFWATVGGMGLTGVITEATVAMMPVESSLVRVHTRRIDDLATLMTAMREADRAATYSVAWIDTLARGRHLGRSVLTTGEHATATEARAAGRSGAGVPREPLRVVPPRVPGGLVNRASIRAFNELWFRRAPRDRRGELQGIGQFFHPLDGIADWNRLYGSAGFVQYQLVLPDRSEDVLPVVLECVAERGHPSFLSVLKRLGDEGPGLLSFPLRGWTLAMDLPAGRDLEPLLRELDELVLSAGGRHYLAKDARMSAHTFDAGYPRAAAFRRVRDRVDPDRVFCSDLARRLEL